MPAAVAALVIAGASATAAITASPAASYSGCGFGYAGSTSTYASGYGSCPTSTSPVATTTAPTTTAPPPTTTQPPVAPPTRTPGSVTTVVGSSTRTTSFGASSSTAKAQVSIPAGALPVGTEVTVAPVANNGLLAAATTSSSRTSSAAYVSAFSISWVAPDGTTPVASKAISLTITDPSLKAGDVVYELVNGSLVRVGVATADGTVTITLTSDPVFVVLAPPAIGLANPAAKLQGTFVGVRLRCVRGTTCHASANLNVARKANGHVTQLTLAQASYGLQAGQLATVRLNLTAAGRKVLAGRSTGGRFYMGLATQVTGGARVVGRVFVG